MYELAPKDRKVGEESELFTDNFYGLEETNRPTDVTKEETGRDFVTKTAEGQAVDLVNLAEQILPAGYDQEAVQVSGTEPGEAIIFQQKFIYKEGEARDYPHYFLKKELKDVFADLAKELFEEGELPYQDLKLKVNTALEKIGNKIFEDKIDEEWLTHNCGHILMIHDALKKNNQTEFFNALYSIKFAEFYKPAFEKIMGKVREEFKIHLNPSPDHIQETTKALMELIRDDEEVKKHVEQFKIACEQNPKLAGTEDTDKVASIVIYPELNGDVEERMGDVKMLVEKLQQKLADLQTNTLPIITHTPLYSFPIDNMISVVQGDGITKSGLAHLSDRRSTDKNTLLEDFFDQELNYSFSKEDRALVQKMFGELQSPEAVSFINRLKLAERDEGKDMSLSEKTTGSKVVGWLKSFWKK